jgi:restriction endonuclease Mrr
MTCLLDQLQAAHNEWVASTVASAEEPDNIVREREMKSAEAKYRALDAAVKDARRRQWEQEAEAMAAEQAAEQAARDARHKAREKAREERAAALAAALTAAAQEESRRLADEFAEAMGYGDDAPQAQGGGGGGDRPCLGDDPLYMRNWDVEDGGGASGEC